MDSTVSISKGCFIYNNGFNKKKHHRKEKKAHNVSLFNEHFISDDWYKSFKSLWNDVEERLQALNNETYGRILKGLVHFVKECHNDETSAFFSEILPCATLLTGINHPDHTTQFEALKEQLLCKVTPHVTIVRSQNSSTIKLLIENIVSHFINADCLDLKYSDELDDSQNDTQLTVKRSQCTMAVLKSWYQELYSTYERSPTKKKKSKKSANQLVIIIPDFENFNSNTLQDLILILSSYSSTLPFVLIFGVATSVSTLHKNFPYHVSSKLSIQVFQSHSSTVYLNQILEKVFLVDSCPFQLSDKPFKFLMDVFLFYDFSVTGFIQGIKFCMMEHFHGSRIKSLCCPKTYIDAAIRNLTDEDLENVRHLPSFRPYVESMPPETRISLLLDNESLTVYLSQALNCFHTYLSNFHTALKLLRIFVASLPTAPLGKQIRELYGVCISSAVVESSQYKECIQLLGFLSKEEVITMLKRSLNLLNKSTSSPIEAKCEADDFSTVSKDLLDHYNSIESASWTIIETDDEVMNIPDKLDRKQLKEKLLSASAKKKSASEYEKAREKLLQYLTKNVFEPFLKPAQSQPFYEIFFFSDVYNVKKHIVGTPRAAIHTALVNPASYLQCKCCALPREETILSTLPDLSIIYKLYLECGKMINLYDWLQAFVTVLDPLENDDDDNERRDIDPQIQARFTSAVSEMQFLGFIKTSKRKTDHVTRLTW
ncbi:origin recognition complex subunit 3 [Arctopsyche grandis]|uniref:origin recognition complex subunit 3 n=1 Tax=Arctopsyche grandis TaxID=121162 RepID=UPI00406D77C2